MPVLLLISGTFFVDIPNMAAIIEKQFISKRRKSSSSRHNYKSAGFNAGFMSHFNQRPVHTKKKKPKTEQKRAGFSFPIPSFATIAVIAGIVVISLAAFNLEDLNIIRVGINDFFPVEEKNNAEKRLIQYSAVEIPGLFGNKPSETKAASETGAVSAPKTEDSARHGMLVTFEWKDYKVKRGDSVSVIAQNHNVSIGAIIASNNIRNARTLQEGTVLRIPNIDGIPYQIQRGDSLSKISTSFNVPLEVILDVNDIKSDNIRIGETLFIPGARMNDIDLRMSLGELFMYPLPGRRYITSYFGMRKDPISGALQFHDGVDFRADTGTTVMASLDGVVSVTGESWLYGKYIILSHGNGYKTLYGHLNAFSVKQGDRVARGRKIGVSGNTGYSTGPHLHFGMYDKNNKLINPLELLN